MDDLHCRLASDPDALMRADGWLRRSGLRPTRQRRTLAALLIGDGCDRHVTADALHSAACRSGEPVSLATVYNTLKAFTEAGLLNEIPVEGARSCFDTRTEPHAHFYWDEENMISDAPDCAVALADLPAPPAGSEIARVDVVIRLKPARRRGAA